MASSKIPLAGRSGRLSGRVFLVHGFNVRDGGANTTDGLAPHLVRAGFEVIDFDTGWRFLSGVRFGNGKRARRLARMIRPGDILIGHSDGCNLINMACWLLSGSGSARKPKAVIYCNPALDRDTQLAPQVESALVFHTRSDWILKVSGWLICHPWGDMGRVGYAEPDAVHDDGRYHNISYEHLGITDAGHSGAFKRPDYLARIFGYISRFIQSLD